MNITNKRNIVKILLLIMFFLLLSGCRPIEGLEPNGVLTEPIEVPVAVEDGSPEEPETIPEQDKTDSLRIQVIADVLNVRETASINSAIVDKVQENAIFEILEETVDDENQIWYKIKTEQEVMGWVFGAYCIAVEDEAVQDTTN